MFTKLVKKHPPKPHGLKTHGKQIRLNYSGVRTKHPSPNNTMIKDSSKEFYPNVSEFPQNPMSTKFKRKLSVRKTKANKNKTEISMFYKLQKKPKPQQKLK